ncbi:MAG: class I SAM-dependent methyltransferase [Xanthomonadales bacterium]|nr:class I SAM-dependent methyltransferase [Xanthomonadales bacterium]
MSRESQQSAGTTHFGYREVPKGEKTALVRGVFDSVAERYDVMNDLMSLGVHRLWKHYFVSRSGVGPGDRVLDLAGGTGDISALLSARVGESGQVILSDINQAMLHRGRARLEDRGIAGTVVPALCNAECLPFADASFDAVTIAFGLRNVTDQVAALSECHRVLRRGGRLLVLEFSRVRAESLRKLYDAYSFAILPALGRLVAGDSDSYRYLAESIRKHPGQETLAAMMRDAGFADAQFQNLSGGVVAIHSGTRS